MRLFSAAFVLGTFVLQRVARLPDEPLIFVAGGMALLAAAVARPGLSRWLCIALAGMTLGYGHGAWRAAERLSDALAFEREGRDLAVTGIVATLPQVTDRGVRFVFHVESGEGVPEWISLSWFTDRESAPPRIVAGQRWSLTVRLRRPRTLANPH